MAEQYTDLTRDPIPSDAGSVTGWKDVPLNASEEPVIPLGSFSDYPNILTDSIYFGERSSSPYKNGELGGSLITHFVRESTAERLVKAQDLLPARMRLVTFDAYRTLEVQQSLYDAYIEKLRKIHPKWSNEDLSVETQKYVSIPSLNPARPSPHNTAGSVDLAIIELANDSSESSNVELYAIDPLLSARLLPFGTKFDHGGSESALAYFEHLELERSLSEEEKRAQLNRRLLYKIMVESGMAPYNEEWWHFNAPESQMGARTDGARYASFGAVALGDANLHHEYVRREYYRKLLTAYQEGRSTVDPYATQIERAAIIAPST